MPRTHHRTSCRTSCCFRGRRRARPRGCRDRVRPLPRSRLQSRAHVTCSQADSPHRRRASRLWWTRISSATIAVPATMTRAWPVRDRGHSANLEAALTRTRLLIAMLVGLTVGAAAWTIREWADGDGPAGQVGSEPGRLAAAGRRRIPRQARSGARRTLRPTSHAWVAAYRRRLLAGEVGAKDPDPPGGGERYPRGADKRQPTRPVPLARVRAAGGRDVASAAGAVPDHLADTRRQGGEKPSLGAVAGGSRADLVHGPLVPVAFTGRSASSSRCWFRRTSTAPGSAPTRSRSDSRRPAATRCPLTLTWRESDTACLQRFRQRRPDRPRSHDAFPRFAYTADDVVLFSKIAVIVASNQAFGRLRAEQRRALRQAGADLADPAGVVAAERAAAQAFCAGRRDRRGSSRVGTWRTSRPGPRHSSPPGSATRRPRGSWRESTGKQPAAKCRFSPAPCAAAPAFAPGFDVSNAVFHASMPRTQLSTCVHRRRAAGCGCKRGRDRTERGRDDPHVLRPALPVRGRVARRDPCSMPRPARAAEQVRPARLESEDSLVRWLHRDQVDAQRQRRHRDHRLDPRTQPDWLERAWRGTWKRVDCTPLCGARGKLSAGETARVLERAGPTVRALPPRPLDPVGLQRVRADRVERQVRRARLREVRRRRRRARDHSDESAFRAVARRRSACPLLGAPPRGGDRREPQPGRPRPARPEPRGTAPPRPSLGCSG